MTSETLPPSNQQPMNRTKFPPYIFLFSIIRCTQMYTHNMEVMICRYFGYKETDALYWTQKRQAQASEKREVDLYIEFYGSKALRDLLKPW